MPLCPLAQGCWQGGLQGEGGDAAAWESLGRLETLSWELRDRCGGLESLWAWWAAQPAGSTGTYLPACSLVLTSLSTSLVAFCPQMKYIQDFQREKQEFERNLARFR